MRTQNYHTISCCQGAKSVAIWLTTLSLILVLAGCSSSEDSGGGGSVAPDVTAPTIVSVSPVDFAASVSVVSPVVVTFSEAVDPASVSAVTVSLVGVPGTATASGNVATFAPQTNLSPDEDYTLQVTAAVRDMAGNTLAESYTSRFHTANVPNADAGVDMVVGRGQTATLDGRGSAAVGGGNLAYDWTQLSGLDVGMLAGPQPSFAVPDSITTLSFELVVTEDGAPSAPDQVTVVISDNAAGSYFVSSAGDDSNQGDITAPMASLQVAINAAATAGGNAVV